jgi:uncharacterized protein YutE (UPF0331/DUF86 family)
MTNINVLENKISSLRKYSKLLERYKGYSQREIENNIDIKGALERYLYLAARAAIDLAEAFISYKAFRKPPTPGESFHILCENKVISDDVAQKMLKMAGFRNVIAHDYEKLNYAIVYDVLQNRLKNISEYSGIIEKQL